MNQLFHQPKVHQFQLDNGMKILIQQTRSIGRVEAHLWYNVGSKHEAQHEKGMAHLLEHMMFKGSALLSETDINLITHKLSGYSNAFTSQDYTCYVFRLPHNVWEHALIIFADCMKNARFEEDHLASEVKTVIEELRMYRDDYSTVAIERALGVTFTEHPYHYPIIGSAHHLANLTRDDLFAFYKKYYHPNNATLVLVGDLDPEIALDTVTKYFSSIPAHPIPSYHTIPLNDDIVSTSTTICRPINSPWSCWYYRIPGIQEGLSSLADLAVLIIGNKSSTLYEKLVTQGKYALDLECFVYEFFEKNLLCISVTPTDPQHIPVISSIISEEITSLSQGFSDQQLDAAKKNLLLDAIITHESIEKQATFLGNHFMATNHVYTMSHHISKITHTSMQELTRFMHDFLRPAVQNAVHLANLASSETAILEALIDATEKQEIDILEHHQRKSTVEQGRYVHTIPPLAISDYTFPAPHTRTLPHNLDLILYQTDHAPYVSIIFSFKANPYYDTVEHSGIFSFLLLLMTSRTAQLDRTAFNKTLQLEGIRIQASFDSIRMYCLAQDLDRALQRLFEVLTEPSFEELDIDFARSLLINEIDLYNDSPFEKVDQLARELIYENHPFSKNPIGAPSTIQNITAEDLRSCYASLITPQESTLIITGQIGDYEDVYRRIENMFGSWSGASIPTLETTINHRHIPSQKSYPLNRDQLVLAFTRDTIHAQTEDYYPLLLLDIIMLGGSVSSSHSRLFSIREATGLFYTIDGSLIYGNGIRPNIMLIKTIVSPEQQRAAEKIIFSELDTIYHQGITEEEFEQAKSLLLSSTFDLFETNISIANTFLFLKKCSLPFNLFDKQGALLSILKFEDVTRVIKKYCNPREWSVIRIGRTVSKRGQKKGD